MLDKSGYTLVHEHLHIDLSQGKNDLDCRLDCYELIRDELHVLYRKGVRNIIEMTNRYMGRNILYLAKLQKETGITIIPSTGYYQQRFYPDFLSERCVEDIAQEMIDEITQGIDDTPYKAGVIAEIGTSHNKITEDEKKVFHAAVLAHQETGAPISTHTTLSTMGLEQAHLLRSLGMDLNHVTIGHCDLIDQPNNILAMLNLGAYVQFDTIGKNSYFPDEKRIEMLNIIKQAGYLQYVMLSMDITRRSHLKANGGIGFSYLLDIFVPQLLEQGFTQEEVTLMLKDNPNRFFG